MAPSPESVKEEVKKVEEAIRERERRAIRQTATSGQVDLNIFPDAIPLASISPELLYASVRQAYGAEFDDSSVRQMLPAGIPAETLNPVALLSLAVRNRRFIQFLGGVLRLEGISRITTIDKFGVGREQVSAVVNGSTDEAFLLCRNLCILLWKASGVERRWEDIAPHAERVRYKSSTIVDLPFPLRDLFRSEVHGFFAETVVSEGGFGKRMGLREAAEGRLEARFPEMKAVMHCREVRFVVSVLDETTGEAEDNTLHFLIKARGDANRALTFVTSELPIAEHTQLVESFVRHVQGET